MEKKEWDRKVKIGEINARLVRGEITAMNARELKEKIK